MELKKSAANVLHMARLAQIIVTSRVAPQGAIDRLKAGNSLVASIIDHQIKESTNQQFESALTVLFSVPRAPQVFNMNVHEHKHSDIFGCATSLPY